MERGDAGAKGFDVDGRHVRETDEPLRVTLQHGEIRPLGDAREPITATGGDDCPDVRIGEHPVELREPPRVRTRQVALPCENAWIEPDSIALAEPADAAQHE